MVWSRGGPRTHAINVTDRYTKNQEEISEEFTEVRIVARSKSSGKRLSVPIKVCLAEETSQQCAFGTSKGETDDTNNFLTFKLLRGKRYKIAVSGLARDHVFQAEGLTQTVSLELVESTADAIENDLP